MTLDAGTTSVRTIIVNRQGKVVITAQQEFRQFFPQPGWVEHDPLDIWKSQMKTIATTMDKANLNWNDCAGIGITNQRETVVLWDKTTGEPVYNAIVWQDQRTTNTMKNYSESDRKFICDRTGLLLSPYFSATKIKWILDNVSKAKQCLKSGRLLMGTIDTWLIWKLTRAHVHATDITNASRTLLFNIHTQTWDKELCQKFGIPMEILPEIKSNSEIYGMAKNDSSLDTDKIKEVPISGVIGDQQGALFGQLCLQPGELKVTYGTGCFMLLNTGTEIINSRHHLLTTIAFQLKDQPIHYALEGSVFIAGSLLQWLRDGLQMITEAKEIDRLAEKTTKNHHVMFVPTFVGLGAPYWDPSSRGAIFGLERGTTKGDIAQAALEGIALQANDLMTAMKKDFNNQSFSVVKVDGGVANSNYLLQFQADISQTQLIKPKNLETTAMGAAYLAGLAVGFWKSIDELKQIVKISQTVDPKKTNEEIQPKLLQWQSAVQRTVNWIKV